LNPKQGVVGCLPRLEWSGPASHAAQRKQESQSRYGKPGAVGMNPPLAVATLD